MHYLRFVGSDVGKRGVRDRRSGEFKKRRDSRKGSGGNDNMRDRRGAGRDRIRGGSDARRTPRTYEECHQSSTKPVDKPVTYHRRVVKSDEERRPKIEYRDSQYK